LKNLSVKELMVPLSEYATVSDDASLFDAVLALDTAQKKYHLTKYAHRAVLIMDKQNHVVGKITQLDVLRSLEPKYKEMQDRAGLKSYGFSRTFMKSLLENYHLWDSPLREICKKAGSIPVKSFMHKPTEGEYIEEKASLDEAIHQLVLGSHQSLLVVDNGNITGVLKLTDVFAAVFSAMQECDLS